MAPGRILTHFSKDLDEIDARLVLLCDQLLTFGSMIALAILVISIIFPLFLGAFVVIFFGFYRIVKYFRPVQKQFKSIEIKSAVPLVSHLGATVGFKFSRGYTWLWPRVLLWNYSVTDICMVALSMISIHSIYLPCNILGIATVLTGDRSCHHPRLWEDGRVHH